MFLRVLKGSKGVFEGFEGLRLGWAGVTLRCLIVFFFQYISF